MSESFNVVLEHSGYVSFNLALEQSGYIRKLSSSFGIFWIS